ncbi:DUF5376 family protein [Fusobacterium polymorphum]|uniref:DUF5376 family protein n=1 Tax=Fusobacterium nucleatum subsp. polymorphum TaxID=76857 RepID=UPI00300B3F8F
MPSRKTINLFKIKKEDKQYDIKFCFIKNIKNDIFPHCEAEKKYKFLFYYLHDPHRTIYNNWSIKFFKFSKKVLEENLPRDPSGEDTAVDVEGDKVIMYDIYFDGDEPDELLEIKKEDLIYILDRWIKFLEKPITDENYEEIFEMEDPVVKVLKDDKYVII